MLTLPRILFGLWKDVDRATRRTSKSLAKRVAIGSALDEALSLDGVTPGATLYTSDCSSAGDVALWHLARVAAIAGNVLSELEAVANDASSKGEAFVNWQLSQPWGALGLSLGFPRGSSTPAWFAQRVDAALRHFDLFSSYRYKMMPDGYGFTFPEMQYSKVLEDHLFEPISAWQPAALNEAPVQQRLRAAKERMLAASHDEIREMLVDRILRLLAAGEMALTTRIDPNIGAAELRRRLSALAPDVLEAKRVGSQSDCIDIAIAWAR